MVELRDIDRELARFRVRILVAAILILILFALLAARLAWLQFFQHQKYSALAESNRTTLAPIVPNRGLIVDRNGVVVATNFSAYTLEIAPSAVDRPLDDLLVELGTVIDIQPRDVRRFKKLLEESKSVGSIPVKSKLSDEEVARFAARRFRFPGVDINARLFRSYPYGELGSHLIGYIGRINEAEKTQIENWSETDRANYRGTERIGKLGAESALERELHGIAGMELVETTAGGRPVRTLHRTPPVPGSGVKLTVDIKLQHLVEELYGSRRGALVALDPRTGEVLAIVSKPTFDPNLFVDGIDTENWQALNESIDKPLLNRALRGTYPPGSTYKPFMALAALQSGKRSADQVIHDTGSWTFGGHVFRSHGNGVGPTDMHTSIVRSVNVYYYTLANEMGVDLIHDFMKPLGFGQLTGIELPGEVRGILPSSAWKRDYYKRPEQKKWYAGETISLGIGQGYNSFTMLQLAQATATLANGGTKHRPHVVMATQDAQGAWRNLPLPPPEDLGFATGHVAVVKRAMAGVTQVGTSARIFKGAQYSSAGKTGTAQAVSIGQSQKYNAAALEEHQRDHSLYIAFAPADEPRIALAAIVENAGFGAAAAAPIARRVFDYWLQGLYPSAEDVDAVRKGQAGAPAGEPRQASAVQITGPD